MGRREFAAWLRQRMADLGLDQNALAARAGISQPMVSKYVNSGSPPSAPNVNRLSRALGVRNDEILSFFEDEDEDGDEVLNG